MNESKYVVNMATRLDFLDQVAIVDHHFDRPPGWTLELAPERWFIALTSILAGDVTVWRGDDGEWRIDYSRFADRLAWARLHKSGRTERAYDDFPRQQDGETVHDGTYLEFEADRVAAEYEARITDEASAIAARV